ncbi:MAG: penicillin-binding protein activator, partial [Candidatus Zixiibacteriota bacterium]
MNGLRILIGLVLFGAAVFYFPASAAADSPEERALLAEGKRQLQAGDWFKAAQTFEELVGRYPESRQLDQFIFYRAKAKYYLNQPEDAIAGFEYFLSRFAVSPARAPAHLLLGNAYYLQGQLTPAVKQYIHAYHYSEDRRLDEQVEKSLKAAFRNATEVSFGASQLFALPEPKRCRLADLLGEILSDRGNEESARQLAAVCNEAVDADRTRSRRDRLHRAEVEIAMVLPLSGELAAFAQHIYDGAAVAAEVHSSPTLKGGAPVVTLTPYDTKGDPVSAARLVGEVADGQALAAVGPLTSEEAAIASARLACATLPLIIPAATQAGLTRLSDATFQLSPNIELQAVTMAEYAVRELQADSAAIITSNAGEYMRMVSAFTQRFRQLGGTIVATEYYRPRDKDFGPYIRDIKTILLGLQRDSIFFVNERGDTLDPDGLP